MSKSQRKKDSSHPIPRKLALTIRFCEAISPRLSNKLALKLFFTPFKYSTPERELAYKTSAIISREQVNQKEITVYQSGQSAKKILLVHGWSGRATQFYKLAPAISKAGYKVFSFTAPAHGSSTDSQTHMLEFTDSINHINKLYGPFEAIVGHSLGAVAALNAIKQGVQTQKMVLIGAPGLIVDVIQDFCSTLGFSDRTKEFLLDYLKKNYDEDYEQYGIARLAAGMEIPGLIIHDEDDKDVSISYARQNHQAWKNSELFETKGLGHRLILSDESVINRIITFLE